MSPFQFTVFLFIFLIGHLYSQNHKYRVEDFYNRNIEVPIDYHNPDKGTFFLYYQLSSNFSYGRPTIFFFQDSQQQYELPGKVNNLGKYFKNYDPFIADDNHNMTIHKECYPLLRNAFFKYDIGSKELREAKILAECKEWKLD